MNRRFDADCARERDRGFVLVLTLLLLGLVSAGVVAVLMEVRAGATGVAHLADAARIRAATQAGTVRAAYGATVSADPLRIFSATKEQPALWRFDGFELALWATPESDRIDVNAGHPDIIAAALARTELDADVRVEALEAISRARAREIRLPGVAALVPPCRRSSADMSRLDDAFTALTGASGVTPRRGSDVNLDLIPQLAAHDRERIEQRLHIGRSPLDDRRLVHLRPYLSDGSSLYRLNARVGGAHGRASEREAVIALALRWPHLRVVRATWPGPEADLLCLQYTTQLLRAE